MKREGRKEDRKSERQTERVLRHYHQFMTSFIPSTDR